MKRLLQHILEIFELDYGFDWVYDYKKFTVIKLPENVKWREEVGLHVRYNTLTGTKQYQADDYTFFGKPTTKWVTYDELEFFVDFRN